MFPESYGDYQLIKKLASGGMAQIFLAHQSGLEGFEKLLVVKRILPHLAENEEFTKMFLDEARIAARLNHPNVVQIFNLGAQGDTYFIAMEYIHGEDVRRVWKRAEAAGKPIPIPLVCRIVMDAAEGLDYAHKKVDQAGKPLGIVHRDISPQNILVTFEGSVKVVDFGIAKAADQATVTKSGVLKGKYSYMSPEQATGQKIDRRSDIFALGIVLYELLTKERLFKRANDIQTLNAVTECDIAPPTRVNPRIPRDLEAVVMKALSKDPSKRFDSAAEMHAALEGWLLQNKVPSSSVHLAAFMQDIYADRLKREAQEGRVLVDELDRSRSPEENLKAPPDLLEPVGPNDTVTNSDALLRDDATKAVDPPRLSQPTVGPVPPEGVSDPARATAPVTSATSVTEANVEQRFPYAVFAVLALLAAAAGGWLWYRANAGCVAHLATDPPGAAVTLDGQPLAGLTTPCTLPKTSPGPHTVVFSKEGFRPFVATLLFPDRGEVTPEAFMLEPEPPAPAPSPKTVEMMFDSAPSGATLWLDGKSVGVTPVAVELVPGATVPIKLQLVGYHDLEVQVPVPADGGAQAFNLEKDGSKKEFGLVRFAVKPGASVECGEFKLGDTPLPDQSLPAGTYRCVLTNAELKQKRVQVVKIEPNVVTRVKVDFNR